ncbi:hypothetical protein WDJ50_18320 (plasmid) [Deinococcus sp. VB142]|uniref:Right-handed parallel beta-helix repeat-containing protein n=1 Tax=Deinococcus sp. VB142 TaxID=3112952 RepID=A0AAU6Q8U8_9DEIO
MTKIKGFPAGYAPSVPLKLVIREDTPYRSPGVGLSPGHYEAVRDGDKWMADGVELEVLMPRFGHPDAQAEGGVSVHISRTDTGRVVERIPYTPSEWVETAPGEFDLQKPVGMRRWLYTQDVVEVLEGAKEATQKVTDAQLDLSEERERVEQTIQASEQKMADIERDTAQTAAQITQQQEANNAATAMNIGRRTALKVALVGAAAGLYNIISGDDAGQVWERLDNGGVVRRPELEAASAKQLQQVQDNLQLTRADLLTGTAGVGKPPVTQILADGSVFSIKPKADQKSDKGIIFDWTPTTVAMRNYSGAVDAAWFGVTYDNTDRGAEFQDAIYATPAGGVLRIDGRFLSSRPHQVNKPMTIVGGSMTEHMIVYLGCDGLTLAPLPAMGLRDIKIAQATRHEITPNTFTAVKCFGANNQRPSEHKYSSILLDGFQTGYQSNYLWASTFDDLRTYGSQIGLDIGGLSVNNFVKSSSILVATQDGSRGVRIRGIDLVTGSAVASEGWVFQQNLIYGGEYNVEMLGVAHNTLTDNIIDFAGRVGIMVQNSADNFAGNHTISGNYIALNGMNGQANAGIRLLNAIANWQNAGNRVLGNYVMTYAGVTCPYGILADGSESKNDLINNNTVRGFTAYDIKGVKDNNQTAIGNSVRSGLQYPVYDIDHIANNN